MNLMKLVFKRLKHVQLTIRKGDEEHAREFYGGLLGLEELEKPEALKARGGLWFQMGNIELHLGVEEFQGESKRHPAFEVENLAAISEYLKMSGVRVKDEIKIPDVERISFFDPFGNRIELMEMTNK
jgi:catechol 2,3-dioxygenase-like lactoylglutathione lyase family enzyme